MIDTEILQDYSSEARELLDEMDNSLMRVEKEGGSAELLNNIFRAVHCIKGSAEYIGLERCSTLTHGVENLLDRVREGTIGLDARIIDFLFRAKDLILTLIGEVSEHRQEKTPISGMMQELDGLLSKSAASPAASAEPADEVFAADQDQPAEMPPQEEEPVEAGANVDPEETATGPNVFDEATSPDGDQPASDGERFYEFFPTESASQDLDNSAETHVDTEVSASTAQETGSVEPEAGAEDLATDTAAVTAQVSGDEPDVTAPAEPDKSLSLEETVPHVLNVSLYLDDLEDGLEPAEVMLSILETVGSLTETMREIGISTAVGILESMRDRLSAIPPDRDRLSPDEIDQLRALLHELRPWYPEGLFPLEQEESSALASASGTDPSFEASFEPSAFRKSLEQIPGLDRAVIDALEDAGFSSVEQLVGAGMRGLTDVPAVSSSTAEFILKVLGGVPAPPKPPSRKPGERSMLADVDDELLREFEGIFGDAKALAEPDAAASNPFPSSMASDLLEELDAMGEDSDREIIEIFLSYAWEITDKLRRLADRIKQGTADRSEIQAAADLIKSIRSSSSYMDYQNLAAFLDAWHEKVLWCAERIDSLSSKNFIFMEESMLKFEHFLNGLEAALNPNGALPLNGATAVQVTEPAAWEVRQPPTYAEEGAGPHRQTGVSDHGFAEISRSTGIAAQPSSEPAREITASQLTGTPQEATTEEILGSMKPAPSMGAQVASEASSAEAQATTSEITDTHEAKLFQDLAAARDVRETGMVRTMRVDSAKVDVLLNQVGELVVNRSYVEQLSLDLKNLHRTLMTLREVGKKEIQTVKDLSLKVGEASLSLGRVANDIQEGVMKLRMLPVGQLFNRMPRLIRDLSRRVGKSVSLEVHGGDTEVDKRVIEQIYNPLVHLIRNAVDHGIEDREVRKMMGKHEEGAITLNAYSQGNQVVIDVEDDGGGINYDAVLQKAIENHMIEPQDAKNVPPQEIYNFLFTPGFSTSKRVTRTSGRGVGMDVVKKDVEKINGHIEIDSWENKGTRISIKIPLTLAIIQTLLIKMGKHMFAIPLTSVREIIQVSSADISTIEGFEVIKFRDETIPVLRMNEVFNLKDYDSSNTLKFLVLATTGVKTVGFLVEELVGEQDVVIKPLAEHVCESRGLAGSTILGDGTIALVLDVTEVIEDVIAKQRQFAATGMRYGQQVYHASIVGSPDM